MYAGGNAVLGSFRKPSSAKHALLAVLMACALACCFANTASARGVVPTDKGPVRGIETAVTKQYLGIPYAAPPVGDLRWTPPQPAARWRALRDAQFANHCPQPASPFGSASTTEDCLYLNVFVPNRSRGREDDDGDDEGDDKKRRAEVRGSLSKRGAHKQHGKGKRRGKHKRHGKRPAHKRLPVMVWFHGGGMVVGESDDYDPTRLVQQGVVVVTVNYRLGFLGFLAHPALTAESPDQASGNYGLMDQQAALRWVKRNIQRFGGDSRNVTIFGQSAGGLSVHSHLASPLSADTFDRAIVQSGAYSLTQPSLAAAETQGGSTAASVGCTDQSAACLRAVPVETLLSKQPTTPGAVGPNVDGKVLTQSIGPALESGEFNRVPVIEGTTHDEFSIFTALNIEFVFGPISPGLYPVIVSILVPTLGLTTPTDAVLNEYPLSDYPSPATAITAIGTDAVFACPGRKAVGAMSQFVPAYAYEFNDPNAPQVFVPPASFPYRAYHASELAYLFDSPQRGGHAPFNPDQETLAATMVRYWTQFARSGSPNGSGAPPWPAYTTANDTYQSLMPPTPAPLTGFAADHHCAFWDSP